MNQTIYTTIEENAQDELSEGRWFGSTETHAGFVKAVLGGGQYKVVWTPRRKRKRGGRRVNSAKRGGLRYLVASDYLEVCCG